MPHTKPKITEADLCRAAKRLRTSTAEVETVAEVESRGEAFYDDGFPVILFERHKFYEHASRQVVDDPDNKGRKIQQRLLWFRKHPDICNPKSGGYGAAGQNQKNKFNRAFALDPTAAMKACSWGKFQLMGFNYGVCGFDTVGEMIDAMKESEGRQLDGFVSFVIGNGLADELRNHDWARFARGYNGPAYKKNKYDTKLANAYNKFKTRKIHCSDLAAAQPANKPNGEQPIVSATNKGNQPTSDEQPPINGTSTVTAEITPEGGVKVETKDGTTEQQRIAVVKASTQKWSSRVTAKITGVVTGNALFQWVWGQVEKLQGLEIHDTVWVVVSITIAVGSLLWIIYEIVDTWRMNRNQERIDDLLVKENSTPTNLVQLIPADEADLYRHRGFKIITRGEKG